MNVLYQVCVFQADQKNKMAALTSDWLRHFWLLLWNCWTEFNETWQEARSQRPLPSFCFSGQSEKQDGRPGLWLADTFLDIFDFSSETTERNLTKLDRKQYLNVLSQVCVFRVDQKIKMAALASDWLRHFRLLLWNRWTEFNETWQETRSQRPLPSLCFSGRLESKMAALASDWLRHFKCTWACVFQVGFSGFRYQVCVFQANRKNKMAVLASDWLRHFRLLLWIHFTEFKETWQEARYQSPVPSLCFSGWGINKNGRPCRSV